MQWLLLLPLIILIPYLSEFLYQPGSPYSDLLISHVPNAIYLRQAVFEGYHLPLWSPSILSGYPFAANPLSGIWYLPGWLAVILPSPLGFNLTIGLHLLFGGIGFYRLMRSMQIAHAAAIISAMVFEMQPKLWSHFFAGHVTLVYAVAWTPWLILAEKHYKTNTQKHRFLFLPGVVLGIIFLADVRWSAYAGLLWVSYLLVIKWDGWLLLKRVVTQVGLAVLTAAPLIIPLMEYMGLSTRRTLDPSDVFALSLPPERLLGLFVSDPGGYAEWVLYPSATALVLCAFALSVPKIRRAAGFWIWSAAISLILSLGSGLPFLSWLASIPGFDLLRVPPRFLFITGFSLAIVAGYSLNFLLEPSLRLIIPKVTIPQAVLMGIVEFLILLTGVVWWLQGQFPIMFGLACLYIGLTAVLVILRLREQIPNQILIWGLLVLTFIDLGFLNHQSFEPHSYNTTFNEGDAVASYLDAQGEGFRVYSPSYSIPQHTAARHGLQLADGIDPLQLSGYVAFMQSATGIPDTSYSVTLPPFPTGNPKVDNQNYLPEPQLLGLLNVRFVAAEYELEQPGLTLRARLGDTRVYENLEQYPRAWVQPNNQPLGTEPHPVKVVRWEPEQVILYADGPGLLVLSEIHYPGWQVWVDGKREDINTAAGFLRRVNLGSGGHCVEFIFRPLTVYVGILLGICTIFALAVSHITFLRGTN